MFNFINVFSVFHYYLPFEKDRALHLNKRCFVPSLVEIGPVVLEKKILKFNQLIFAICIS